MSKVSYRRLFVSCHSGEALPCCPRCIGLHAHDSVIRCCVANLSCGRMLCFPPDSAACAATQGELHVLKYLYVMKEETGELAEMYISEPTTATIMTRRCCHSVARHWGSAVEGMSRTPARTPTLSASFCSNEVGEFTIC